MFYFDPVYPSSLEAGDADTLQDIDTPPPSYVPLADLLDMCLPPPEDATDIDLHPLDL